MIPKLTKQQAVIVTGATGFFCCSDFGDYHAEVEKRMGRPVWTHEMGSKEISDQIKALFLADFIAMVPEK